MASLEHVIPKVLGGALASRILCKQCNDFLGSEVDCHAQRDDSLRAALLAVGDRIPAIRDRVLHGMGAEAITGLGPIPGTLKDGAFKIKAGKLADDSIIQSVDQARRTVDRLLKHEGIPDSARLEALASFDKAPEGVRTTLSSGVDVVQWKTREIKPTLKGDAADDRLFVKIAFEFLAISVGGDAYGRGLNSGRQRLIDPSAARDVVVVEYLQGADYDTFHGIAIEQNEPFVRVHMRLFGKLAYRVSFRNVTVSGPRWVYTHLLDKNEESMATW